LHDGSGGGGGEQTCVVDMCQPRYCNKGRGLSGLPEGGMMRSSILDMKG
jgi:hypothetical protein